MTLKNGSVIRAPGVLFATVAATQKLSKIHMEPVDGMRKYRPYPTEPFVCATYVSIESTCPDTCVFKNAGCFAQNGFIRRITRPLDVGLSGIEVARNEAALMDRAFRGRWGQGQRIPQDGRHGGRDLRLHVGGDVSGPDAVRILADAARRWKNRGGGDVWTYTHRWREVPAELWGPIRVWASTETAAEAREAQAQGYRASMTIDHNYTTKNRHSFNDLTIPRTEGLDVIPCPWETRKVPCNHCRLCLREAIPGSPVIGFVVHGNKDSGDLAKSQAAVRNKRRLAVVG